MNIADLHTKYKDEVVAFNLKGLISKLKGKTPQEKAYAESLKHLMGIQEIANKMWMNKDKWGGKSKKEDSDGVELEVIRKSVTTLAKDIALMYGIDWYTGEPL